MSTGGLSRWFNENWVDLSRPKKGGGYEPCGRTDASEGKYPKCVPASRAARMTPEEIKSAIQRKRRAESTQTREDKKPIMVATVKKENVPADMELYNRVKAEAKRKFDVYPSAYANGWLVQEYKRRGGKYKTISKHGSHDQMTHGRRGGMANFSKVPSSGKGKTQKQKDAEVDALNELEYHLYSTAPSHMKHDEAISYATSPEGQSKIEPDTLYPGSIGAGDFLPRFTKPVKVKSEIDRSQTIEVDITEMVGSRSLLTSEARYLTAARQQQSIKWLEVRSTKTEGEGSRKFTVFTMSDGSKIRIGNNNKAYVWSPGAE